MTATSPVTERVGATFRIGWVLAVAGAVGAAASFALILERIALLKNPFHVPSCSVDAVLSCGSIMTSAQSELLGFPNPLIGLVTFPVVTTIGAVVLSGARPGRVIWLGLQLGSLAGVVLVHWLIVQSLYAIGALCPYCMVVWVVTITTFWYTTVRNAAAGVLPLPAGVRRVVTEFHGAGLALWLIGVAALVVARFGAYWTA